MKNQIETLDATKIKFFEFFKRYFEKGFNKIIEDDQIQEYWNLLSILSLESISKVCKDLYSKNRLLIASPSLILHKIESEIGSSVKELTKINPYNTCYIKDCMLQSDIKLGVDNSGTEVFLCRFHEDEYWLAERIVKYESSVKELKELHENAHKSLKIFIYHWQSFMRRDYVTRI